MEKSGIKAAAFGLIVNFLLFLLKLYMGISTNSLSIYCDAINNLGDTLSCIIAAAGFFLVMKFNERKGLRVQSLSSFVIGLIVTVTGGYFAYSGLERLMYPTHISYSRTYALLIFITIFVKLAMAIIYSRINKKAQSPVIKTLTLDSFMDTAITLTAFLGFTLSELFSFAVDGIVSVIIGTAVCICALKTVIEETKILIND